jgi:hypothetical protein
LTFETNYYNLGSYLIDNAEEIYLSLSYKPNSKLTISTSYTQIHKGNDYPYLIGSSDPKVDEFVFLKDIIWKKQQLEFQINYNITNNTLLIFGISKSIIKTKSADGQTDQYYLDKYTSPFEQGNHLIINGGLNIGI